MKRLCRMQSKLANLEEITWKLCEELEKDGMQELSDRVGDIAVSLKDTVNEVCDLFIDLEEILELK